MCNAVMVHIMEAIQWSLSPGRDSSGERRKITVIEGPFYVSGFVYAFLFNP